MSNFKKVILSVIIPVILLTPFLNFSTIASVYTKSELLNDGCIGEINSADYPNITTSMVNKIAYLWQQLHEYHVGKEVSAQITLFNTVIWKLDNLRLTVSTDEETDMIKVLKDVLVCKVEKLGWVATSWGSSTWWNTNNTWDWKENLSEDQKQKILLSYDSLDAFKALCDSDSFTAELQLSLWAVWSDYVYTNVTCEDTVIEESSGSWDTSTWWSTNNTWDWKENLTEDQKQKILLSYESLDDFKTMCLWDDFTAELNLNLWAVWSNYSDVAVTCDDTINPEVPTTDEPSTSTWTTNTWSTDPETTNTWTTTWDWKENLTEDQKQKILLSYDSLDAFKALCDSDSFTAELQLSLWAVWSAYATASVTCDNTKDTWTSTSTSTSTWTTSTWTTSTWTTSTWTTSTWTTSSWVLDINTPLLEWLWTEYDLCEFESVENNQDYQCRRDKVTGIWTYVRISDWACYYGLLWENLDQNWWISVWSEKEVPQYELVNWVYIASTYKYMKVSCNDYSLLQVIDDEVIRSVTYDNCSLSDSWAVKYLAHGETKDVYYTPTSAYYNISCDNWETTTNYLSRCKTWYVKWIINIWTQSYEWCVEPTVSPSGFVRAKVDTNLCLDISWWNLVEWANIILNWCNSSNSQKYVYDQNLRLNLKDTDYCLSVNSVSNNVELLKCSSSNNQKWTKSWDAIISNLNNYCLDIWWAQIKALTNVQTYECNLSDAQKWLTTSE